MGKLRPRKAGDLLNLLQRLRGRFQPCAVSAVFQDDTFPGLLRTSSGRWVGGAQRQKSGSGRSQPLIRKTFQQGLPQLLERFEQTLATFLVSMPHLVPVKQMNGQWGE